MMNPTMKIEEINLKKCEVVKHCKSLLRLVNCEAVSDANEDTLYDILFKSHSKKTMLLSWIIQQLFSAECCTNNSFEELVSSFIPEQMLSNFLSGKMAMVEQYRYWKLALNVLHQRQKRKIRLINFDFEREVESGNFLENYEFQAVRNEKLMSNLNYVDLSENECKLNASELRSLLETAKFDNVPVHHEQFSPDDEYQENSHTKLFEQIVCSDKKLSDMIEAKLETTTPIIHTLPLGGSANYRQLNRQILNDFSNKLRLLKENIEVSRRIINGAEDWQV